MCIRIKMKTYTYIHFYFYTFTCQTSWTTAIYETNFFTLYTSCLLYKAAEMAVFLIQGITVLCAECERKSSSSPPLPASHHHPLKSLLLHCTGLQWPNHRHIIFISSFFTRWITVNELGVWKSYYLSPII